MQSDLREDQSVNFFSAASTSTATTQLPMNPVDIAKSIRNEVIDWNFSSYKSLGVRGTSGWKQQLKNNFAFFMRFQDSDVTQGSWKQHLQAAANRTIEEMCPDWKSDSAKRAMYESIKKIVLRKRCPTSGWLVEKAYAWLKWLSQKPDRPQWYSIHAIAVAYELFLSGSGGRFSTLLNYLKGKHPAIDKLLQAHESNVASCRNSNAVDHSASSGCLHIFQNGL